MHLIQNWKKKQKKTLIDKQRNHPFWYYKNVYHEKLSLVIMES